MGADATAPGPDAGAGRDVSVADGGGGADGDSALWRGAVQFRAGTGPLAMSAVEMVPDVEKMRVAFTADRAAAAAGRACIAEATERPGGECADSVRVALLIASPPKATAVPAAAAHFALLDEQLQAPLDSRLRSALEITVALRNAIP